MAQAHRSLSISSSRVVPFLLKLALYTLPFAIPFLLLTGFLIYTGESMPLSMVVAMQQGDDPVLYRPRYGNRDFDYKLLATNTRQPEVVALGSSHALQFRSMFFNQSPDNFYDAAGPAWQFEHIEAFLEQLDYNPQVLILTLDHPWFNDNYPGDPFQPSLEPTSDFEQIFSVNRSVLQSLIRGEPLDVNRYLQRVDPTGEGIALGLRAIRDAHGFRNDGSEFYGDFLVAQFLYPENERARHLSLMQNGEDMYARGDTVSQTALNRLAALLQKCQERGIYVIGILPPFAPTLYREMTAGGQHTYMQQLVPAMQPLFDQYGGSLFDFSDPALLDAADTDFFDGWHGSERMFLRLYTHILRTLPNVLSRYSDLEFLEATDANATNTFNIFYNRFR